MKKVLIVLQVILAFLFIGCASTSKTSKEDSDAAKTFAKLQDKGVVYLYREGKAFASAVATPVKVNGLDAGGTGPGTFFRWELKPGTYTFSSFAEESSAVVQVEVAANEHYFLRQNLVLGVTGARVTLEKQPEDKGMKEVKSCNLLVSAYIPQ